MFQQFSCICLVLSSIAALSWCKYFTYQAIALNLLISSTSSLHHPVPGLFLSPSLIRWQKVHFLDLPRSLRLHRIFLILFWVSHQYHNCLETCSENTWDAYAGLRPSVGYFAQNYFAQQFRGRNFVKMTLCQNNLAKNIFDKTVVPNGQLTKFLRRWSCHFSFNLSLFWITLDAHGMYRYGKICSLIHWS